ncbi:FUSC family protein [Actinoplanes aureus]|uniref:FUSC family protein n=1 Tax=Actinoplanes aureus TaxID=2792083 RepID=UPI001E4533E5|nr:aromatic acid exporter family protein [Actinoplanes aureus]
MRLPVYVRHPRSAVLARWGRVPGLRTAKATLAAVLAYVVADLLNTTEAPILAPLTALLVVQLTVYETVAQGIQRILSVLAGVLVALAIATFVGLSWWSLGAVVAVSLVVGQVLRLGPHTVEVPISAMLVLAVGGGGAEGAAAGRVYETLIGAAIGLAVNFAVAPPVNVLPAGDAIGRVATQLAKILRGLAGELRQGWSRAAADRWLKEARALGPHVSRADLSLARAERSALLNPRGDEVREAQPRLRNALTGLDHCYVVVRTLCRELFDRTLYLPPDLETEAYGPDTRDALADVLECASQAMDAVADVATGAGPVEVARARVQTHLDDLQRRRDRLGQLLVVDPHADAAAWQQHGALLATVDRLRVETEAAVRPASEPWRPPLIAEESRQAVRRVIDAAAKEGRPRQAVRRVIDVAADAATTAAAATQAAADDLLRTHPQGADADNALQAERLATEAAAVAHVAAELAAEAEVESAETAAEESERPDRDPPA